MQMYGKFEGFPLNKCIVWVGNIMTPGRWDMKNKTYDIPWNAGYEKNGSLKNGLFLLLYRIS